MEDIIAAMHAPFLHDNKRPQRAGAARTGVMRIAREVTATWLTESALLGRQGLAAGDTDIRIEEGKKALGQIASETSQVAQHRG